MVQAMTPTATRVEQHTSPEINERIRKEADQEVQWLEGASAEEITARIEELEKEWDVERLLQMNSSVLVLSGVILGHKVNPKWFLLSAAVYTFFFQHAVQGWCPPIPIFRRLGIRTQKEIDREKYALKVLRGDFQQVPEMGTDLKERVRAVLRAVDA